MMIIANGTDVKTETTVKPYLSQEEGEKYTLVIHFKFFPLFVIKKVLLLFLFFLVNLAHGLHRYFQVNDFSTQKLHHRCHSYEVLQGP